MSSDRQKAFYERQKEKGLIRQNVWIHKSRKGEFLALVRRMQTPADETEIPEDLPSFLKPQNFF